MPAQYAIGQQLPNGATVTADSFKTWPDGSSVEIMVDSARNETIIQTDAPNGPAANQRTLQQRAQAALTGNATFLAIASPTTAQTLAQVKALTKETTAVIRLLLGLLDDTTGT